MAPRKNSANRQIEQNGEASEDTITVGQTSQHTIRRQPPQHKFDPAEHYRSEIERRTALGETCEQIASALRAQGVEITNKTISRRRVEWGLRKRPFSKLLGKKATVPRPKKTSGTKSADTNARKAEIKERTLAGQSAEEIADALQQGGYVLKKGASTVLRLQTQWGFIEPDADRARGRKKRKRGDGDAEGDDGTPKVRKKDLPRLLKEQEREANKVQQMQAQTLHYPSNCSFGPKKRTAALRAEGGEEDDGAAAEKMDDEGAIMPGLDAIVPEPGSLPYPHDPPPPHTNGQQQQSVSLAAEIMSVEFLVDLATSTLSAAENLKAMLLASQARQPVYGSVTGLPPSGEDLTVARRKVREAAAVMHDLAAEPARE